MSDFGVQHQHSASYGDMLVSELCNQGFDKAALQSLEVDSASRVRQHIRYFMMKKKKNQTHQAVKLMENSDKIKIFG
jgi:hypothetical protein